MAKELHKDCERAKELTIIKPKRLFSSLKCKNKKIRKMKKREYCPTSPIPVTESRSVIAPAAISTTATVSTRIISSIQATTAVSSVGITTARVDAFSSHGIFDNIFQIVIDLNYYINI